MAHTYKTRYKVGDRVKLIPSLTIINDNCTNGIVVYYKGKHSQTSPRVRWYSGWATTVKTADLVPLELKEIVQLYLPLLCAIDYIKQEDKI
jgi:hypothetical protein